MKETFHCKGRNLFFFQVCLGFMMRSCELSVGFESMLVCYGNIVVVRTKKSVMLLWLSCFLLEYFYRIVTFDVCSLSFIISLFVFFAIVLFSSVVLTFYLLLCFYLLWTRFLFAVVTDAWNKEIGTCWLKCRLEQFCLCLFFCSIFCQVKHY